MHIVALKDEQSSFSRGQKITVFSLLYGYNFSIGTVIISMANNIMKIAYVTVYDVLNETSWPKYQSGMCAAGYYLAKKLTDYSVLIDYIGPLKEKKSLTTKVKWHLYHHLLGKEYYGWVDPFILKDYAYQISKKLSILDSDIVLCPENVVPISYLECNQPIVLWTDSTLYSLINYYSFLSNLCKETIRNIQAMEKAALNRCKLAIYTSDWAAQSAVNIYGIEPSKVKVVPWGANIECDRSIDDIFSIVESRASNQCKLLFIGVDWIRKGGNVALEVARELNTAGLNTELTIVGCQPAIDEPLPQFVNSLGYINKSTEEGWKKINRLLTGSHFLILPTVADCAPHVLVEANSFGVPCLATKVGGIPTIINDNLNGKTFDIDASITEYCTYICTLFSNYFQYKKLALSSFNEYQTRLNWSVAVHAAKKLLVDLMY